MSRSDKSQELLSVPSLGARRPLSSPAGTAEVPPRQVPCGSAIRPISMRQKGEELSQPQLWPHRALSDSRFTRFPALFLENKRTRQPSGPQPAGRTPLPSPPHSLPL